MSLDTSIIGTIDGLLLTEVPPADLGDRFRQLLPGLTVTRCHETDMGMETPFRNYPAFILYLVNGSRHCWAFTTDPAEATSIVLAKRRRA